MIQHVFRDRCTVTFKRKERAPNSFYDFPTGTELRLKTQILCEAMRIK